MIKYFRSAFVLCAMIFAGSVSADDAAVDAKYQKTCKVCHEAGLMGAPKSGDAAAWAPRLAKGNDVLLKHIKEGFNSMPPKGLCTDCTDEEYLKMVQKMAK